MELGSLQLIPTLSAVHSPTYPWPTKTKTQTRRTPNLDCKLHLTYGGEKEVDARKRQLTRLREVALPKPNERHPLKRKWWPKGRRSRGGFSAPSSSSFSSTSSIKLSSSPKSQGKASKEVVELATELWDELRR